MVSSTKLLHIIINPLEKNGKITPQSWSLKKMIKEDDINVECVALLISHLLHIKAITENKYK
jgi:hypothetical protein